MRKAMIEEMIYNAMHEDPNIPKTDTVHSMNEYLPAGESPLTKQEDDYLTKRLLEENDKLTEWPEIIYAG